MGGRGGLNILPQKKWNVYNWDNRIKVKQNEAVVDKEIERRKLKHRQKRLVDKISKIKFKSPQSHSNHNNMPLNNASSISDKEKNEIFKEIMQRKSILNRVDYDANYKNNNKLISMNESIDYEKLKSQEEINVGLHEKSSTIIETLHKNLKPWYMQKKAEDYKEYKEFKMLSSKRERDNDIEKEKVVSIEDLRQERKKREAKEHNRILALLNKVKS